MAIFRMAAVKAETGHRSHASIYTAIKAGTFTKPVPIGSTGLIALGELLTAIGGNREFHGC